jgi:hypothetical protein
MLRCLEPREGARRAQARGSRAGGRRLAALLLAALSPPLHASAQSVDRPGDERPALPPFEEPEGGDWNLQEYGVFLGLAVALFLF